MVLIKQKQHISFQHYFGLLFLSIFFSVLAQAQELQQGALPPLPLALSNNAVAQVQIAGRQRFFSFFGIGSGLTYKDISRAAFEYDSDAASWHVLPPVPGAARLASAAVGLRGNVYLFGGSTVNADGGEKTTDDVWRYDPLRQNYESLPPMPVSVDDTVALAWRDRYVIIISGWSDSTNVATVQILDINAEKWLRASEFPGVPVFGHSAGLLDDDLVLCGGVKMAGMRAGKRQYELSRACYSAHLDPDHVTDIRWKELRAPMLASRYRAAAAGTRLAGRHIVFAGGSNNPYNYNGIGYDDEPANPVEDVLAYNLDLQRWENWGHLPVAAMDHRGLLQTSEGLLTIGGMERNQRVSQVMRWFAPPLSK